MYLSRYWPGPLLEWASTPPTARRKFVKKIFSRLGVYFYANCGNINESVTCFFVWFWFSLSTPTLLTSSIKGRCKFIHKNYFLKHNFLIGTLKIHKILVLYYTKTLKVDQYMLRFDYDIIYNICTWTNFKVTASWVRQWLDKSDVRNINRRRLNTQK